MSMDIKPSKAQLSKIIQSGWFFGNMIGKLAKKTLMNVAILFTKDALPKLVSNVASNSASNAINKFERETSGKGVVKAEKGFTLFISNEDIDDIWKIVESLENSCLWIDRASETVKQEMKKQKGGFAPGIMAPMAAS